MKHTGKIVVLAFPDTFVRGSTELICKLLPFVGLGTKKYIKAGHAALLLIENKTGNIRYFDFGRYVTPFGHGRVRSAQTDAELYIDFKARIASNGALLNSHEIIKWVDKNPQKTHGSGRLLASVCDEIDFKKAEQFILSLQNRGSIPYGVFEKDGSNCSRLVADTLLESTKNSRILKRLKFNKIFTPSTVGNVEIAATNGLVYEVKNGKVFHFNGTAFRENLTNYFDKKNVPNQSSIKKMVVPNNLQILEGIGSSAFFEIVSSALPANHYRIKRYNDLLEVDFDGVYVNENFSVDSAYTFTYDSHCEYCHILQNGTKIKLVCVGRYVDFNSLKKEHSI